MTFVRPSSHKKKKRPGCATINQLTQVYLCLCKVKYYNKLLIIFNKHVFQVYHCNVHSCDFFLMVMSDYIVISVMKDNFKHACRFLKS